MKKTILTITALVVLTLTSCREEVAVETTEETVTEEITPTVEETPAVEEIDSSSVEVDSIETPVMVEQSGRRAG